MVMPLREAMAEQLSPLLTKSNLLQLLTMPGCVGVGVVMPLPVVVVEVVGVVVVVPAPITPTQTYTFPQSDVQSAPALFHSESWATVMPLRAAMALQLSPGLTKSNLLQLLTMPGWEGVGVVMPLPVVVLAGALVVVVVVTGGMPKFRSTQYDWPALRVHPVPTDGFLCC